MNTKKNVFNVAPVKVMIQNIIVADVVVAEKKSIFLMFIIRITVGWIIN